MLESDEHDLRRFYATLSWSKYNWKSLIAKIDCESYFDQKSAVEKKFCKSLKTLKFVKIGTGGAYKDGPEIWVARPVLSFLFCFCRARPKFSGPSTYAKKSFLARPYMRIS